MQLSEGTATASCFLWVLVFDHMLLWTVQHTALVSRTQGLYIIHMTCTWYAMCKKPLLSHDLAWEVLEPQSLGLVVAVHIDEVGCVHHHSQTSLILHHKGLAVIGAKLDG